ncbi:MAG: glycoside hydrolase family 127 protein [Chloroflexi bacterium]|nr:glycoside hydrolase family 127 protein [Chloroflexota bacterium]
MTINTYQPFVLNRVELRPGLFNDRFNLNRKYLMSLSSDNLLQNFYLEAGLWSPPSQPVGCHWGWESPTSQVRGHFLGHWLSAAARIYACNGDAEIKAKADHIVAELGRCQRENGGEWVGSIPEKYLDWVARGKTVWAPHYTVHKTLMGLFDMASLAGNAQALDIMLKWANWFHRWTSQFTRQQMDDILDTETGGMLEAWANLYGVTHEQNHLDLVYRYDRPRLFDRLLAGEDALTNMHANTTIPEVHGAARAWEVTGDQRWRDIVEAYWRMAVVEREAYCTGGQTCGEIWTPPGELSARLGDKNQEHCTVYNMMRLAEYLLRWSGDVTYADYWERNLYNGILAQQHPQTGMIAYFLPLQPGALKVWGTPTEHFWCCHGTLVQAHTLYAENTYYQHGEDLVVSQYIPSTLTWQEKGNSVRVAQQFDTQTGSTRRPANWVVDMTVTAENPVAFTLKLRLPSWLNGQAHIEVNGVPAPVDAGTPQFASIRRTWQNDRLRITLPKGLSAVALPDEPDTVAFLDGPVVLAGVCDEERLLRGDKAHPETMLAPDNEREWANWIPTYRTRRQEHGLRFKPLYDIRDERYTVYFPVSQ